MSARGLSAGCSSSHFCIPGAAAACTCTDGRAGAQPCNAAGSGYEPCVCEGSAFDSGIADAGDDDAGAVDAFDPRRDAMDFCVNREGLVCQRDFYAGRITLDQFNTECFPTIMVRCDAFTWGSCIPDRDLRVACLAALGDEARYAMPTSDIDECRATTLCP